MAAYKYQFKNDNDMDKLRKKMDAGELSEKHKLTKGSEPEQAVLIYGKMRKLFGNPLNESEDVEVQYGYCITTMAESGDEIVLDVVGYYPEPIVCSSGDEESHAAVNQLLQAIEKTEPADYKYKGVWIHNLFDPGSPSVNISMGIKNGKPYIKEKPLFKTKDNKSKNNIKYQFKAESSMDKLNRIDSSHICNIIDDFSLKEQALIYGKLRGLFGEPLYETENTENQYSYCIIAVGEDGSEVILNAYCSSSGPAIGGRQNPASDEAAEQLVQVIQKAKPADYEYNGFYYDGPSKIHMGVKNGIPFAEEEELD